MTRRRFDLTDFEWSIIQPLLPDKPRGVPRVDDRRVINGILWRFRTGSPGQMSLSATAPTQPATIVLSVGERLVSGTMCWRRSQRPSTAISS